MLKRRETLLGLLALPLACTAWASGSAVPAPDWQASPLRLMMVEQVGCIYCEKWDREIGPGFDQSAQGRTAPLLRVNIDGPWPDRIVLGSRPMITPTFILLDKGAEVARIEGYVGKQNFYPVLGDMMQKAGISMKRTK